MSETFRGTINVDASDNSLPSWNATNTRHAIVEFVESVTADGKGHLPSEARVAVFDNDGTLWCEQPMPVQFDFLVRRMDDMAQQDPSLLDRHPWKAVAAKDYGWLSGVFINYYHGDDGDLKVLAAGILAPAPAPAAPLPASGGMSLLALGAGVLLVVSGLLARRIVK